MSYNSKLTRKRILSEAHHAFLSQGFQSASLRDIAKKAHVTTGAMYNHFKNKEVLFEALVELSASELLNYIRQTYQQVDGEDNETIEKTSLHSTDKIIDYIYNHFDDFKLIFCCSTGSKYENYLSELAEIEEEFQRKVLDREGIKVNDHFLHVICVAGFQDLYEIVDHDLSKEEAIEYMDTVKCFRMAGWKAILNEK
ncbi:TetR/AcrR family transcriptional regulator [Gracilibacillus alcaliphilus]|uniref:TetR/AcrR family transcriptional regulator n=1 Tax=Gracilibacillus alcaliphilus TaxID=1401441 RepID=UPI001958DD09|nr:TetR/AcrR family transcriptional regulator [Gracilibacillus alcaliphilus]MBM7678846.1 AcrR family transcriptional regulator [Gracilibacillus alcaliphilus]